MMEIDLWFSLYSSAILITVLQLPIYFFFLKSKNYTILECTYAGVIAIVCSTFFFFDLFKAKENSSIWNSIVLLALTLLWSFRLIIHLLMKGKPASEESVSQTLTLVLNYPKRLIYYLLLQILTIWVNILPLPYLFITVNKSGYAQFSKEGWLITVIIGLSTFIIGLGFETLADYQKYKFKLNPHNFQKDCAVGLWSLCKRPNYFGEFLVWNSFAIFLIPYVTNFSIIILFLGPFHVSLALLHFSGILPPNRAQKTDNDDDLIQNIPAFFPFCNFKFCLSPNIIDLKRIGFGLGMYRVATGKWIKLKT